MSSILGPSVNRMLRGGRTRSQRLSKTLQLICDRRCYRSAVSKLSPYDVNQIICANEFTNEFSDGSVKSYDSNQLASNSPIEDVRSEASCLLTSGLLLGVFDGHAGPSCAQIIAKRLLRYIGTSLVPADLLRQQMANGARSDSFLRCHNDKVDFVTDLHDIYESSFANFTSELCAPLPGSNFQMEQAMENAFVRLDEDISTEALAAEDSRTMAVAMSGSVACVAHIDGAHLHVASTGDCAAVLGTITDTGQWQTTRLTNEHNSDNVAEVRRILGEHPAIERDSVIRGERLLGQLAPLRAFGDFRYKWPADVLEKVGASYGQNLTPPFYLTPPYLTARPEIQHHILTPRDRFMVIASDGLWDMMSPMQVVKLVGEHMSGKAFLQPLKLPKKDVTLGDISQMLSHRKAGLSKKPLDKNAATHLIRNALGGTEYGIEHSKISHILSLPHDIVRLFRDDITVTVVYFDQEFLRNCPV